MAQSIRASVFFSVVEVRMSISSARKFLLTRLVGRRGVRALALAGLYLRSLKEATSEAKSVHL
jgi:hypothetical protein